jgi:hypothetical protein
VIQAGCTLYSCTISKRAFIGAGSVILEGAVIEEGAIVAPNSVVPPGRVVPAYQVWGGNPIKFIRHAREQTGFVTANIPIELYDTYEKYKYQFLPYNNAYLYKQNTAEVQIFVKFRNKTLSTMISRTIRKTTLSIPGMIRSIRQCDGFVMCSLNGFANCTYILF